ncbi:putative tetratricopeptide-like helical domain superfamily [Helianthus anomalus]
MLKPLSLSTSNMKDLLCKKMKHIFLQKHFITSNTLNLHENVYHGEITNNCNKPNAYDLVHKIRECTPSGLHNHGQQLHCYVLRSGFISNVYVSSALINFYGKLDLVKDAHKVFDEIPEPGLVAWNSLISRYFQSGKFRQALSFS